ncbi:amino acid adenylation domain-containing protein, partial [Corallococcus sp. CA031C]
MLGILKAGAAYVPLDAGYPRERLAFMVEDAGVEVLVTQASLRGALPEGASQVVGLDDEDLNAEPTHAPESGGESEDPAYVIYTSGSTGKPKGVWVPHRAVVRLVVETNFIQLTEEDRIAQVSNASFDAATFEVWGALLHGGRLVGMSRDVALSPAAFAAYLREERISTLFVTSALFNQLVAQSAEMFQTVRQLHVGGDAVDPGAARAVLARGAPGKFVNAYGPTESTTFAAWHAVEALAADAVTVPIGRPLSNTELYVLDAELQPVPVGVLGELYIGGDGLALGYLGRPELTAEKFVPHPFRTQPGARLYRTGDQVKQLPDGSVVYLGRLDSQVKVRGFRIELGEVESALSRCEGVSESVVVVREETPGIKRLVAYVGGAEATRPTVDALRTALKGLLPEYMVPATFVMLESLPLTPNGKVDRKALPAPQGERPDSGKAFVAPRTLEEQTLAAIWASVLGVEKVGIHDNFFALGGDSIISIQIISRANQAGLRLMAKQLFQHQTVAELAQVATAALASQAEQGIVRGPLPLTPIQAWFFERELTQPHHFNQAVMIEARQRVDAGLLEKALARLVEHHDALRLRYVRGESGWMQENAGLEQPVSLRRQDVSAFAGDEDAQRRAIQVAATGLHQSLRLEEGLLLRAMLFERGEGQTERLLLVVHHLAVDGVSWRVLLEDLNTAYQQLRRGVPVALPAKTTSFQAWARRLEAHARSPELESERSFWLGGTKEVAPLPVDHTGPNTLASADSVRAVLEAEETRALLQEVPAAYRAHINDVLLAALTHALTRWTGQDRVRINLEGHGREELFADADISRTVGWFTTVYPVLLEAPAGGSLGDGLRSVRDTLRRLPNKGLGYGLLRYLGDGAEAAKLKAASPAQVAFNYLGQFDAMAAGESMFGLAKEPAGPGQGQGGLRTALLELNGLVINGRLELSWTYSANVHERSTVEALAESFLGALRSLIAQRESDDAKRYTPADFPLARLDAPGLARLQTGAPDLEDVYPLSPLQQGMLFHALLEPASGMYCEQMAWSFHGTVNLPVMRRAWELLVARNPVLRTSFVWDGLPEPLQVVHASAELPWRELDWRGLSSEEQQELFQQYLVEDRARGFDVGRAPLLRLTVVRLDEQVLRCLWSIHHLLLDGWSMSLLIQELFGLYRALDQGLAVPTERAVPYREFIGWLQRQDASRMDAFWKRELAGLHAPTPLPYDDRAAQAKLHAQDHAEKSTRLSAASTLEVDAFVKRHQLTLNTLVQAAWALVLARHSGEAEVVLGATVSGRPSDLPGVERMTGMFINTLPVRVPVPGRELVVPWLRELQARQLELRQYEHSPLVRVQGFSQVPRGTPLFQSLFVFENYPIDSTLSQRASVLEVRDVQGSERSNFPLTASSSPSRELLLKLAFDTPRFETATIERLLGQWKRAVEGLVAAESGRVWQVGVLSQEEQRRVLVEWNQTAAEYPREASIGDAFDAQVARRPDAVALEAGDVQLTYAQLDARANQLAHLLRKRGVGPESRVALCLERGVDLVVALLAILKAGGAYVPLEADYPRDRLAFMLSEAGPRVLVTTRELGARLPTEGLDVLCVEEERESLSRQPTSPVVSGVGGGNLAYVDFTSGSTGRPKGVCTEHAGVLRTVLNPNYARLEAEDTLLLVAPVSFDASTLEVWGALLNGARLVVYPPVPVGDVKEMEGVLKRHGVTVLHLTAGLFTQMVEGNLEGLRGVKQLLTGGDVVSAPHVKRALEVLGVTVTACYGPTEGTLFTSCHRMETVESVGATVPIGRPIGNTQVYVLDGQWQPVPAGVAAELYAAGDGLARGYLGRPELTAAAFLPNPYGPLGSRMYRTGDLARWRADGVLEFLGRGDTQVKVRGFRVELAEVEAALGRCEGVRECVVVARGEGAGNKRLVAYVVGEGLDVASVRSTLKDAVPEYMVPSAFVVLPALPLTANGKVDRKALPEPREAGVEVSGTYVAPRTPTEEVLAGDWAQVLGVGRVGTRDNFFELGGHSLLATQAISRIRSSLGVQLPLRALFEAPTVAELALKVDAAALGAKAPPLLPVARTGPLPLSFAQQRLWFLDQLEPGSTAFNMFTALRLEGTLDVAALERAFQELVRRHESLRTTFQAVGQEPVQRISHVPEQVLARVDLRALEESERELEARRVAGVESRWPFGLGRGPLFRATLLQLGERQHLLLLAKHHIISDGWSMGVLVREVTSLYESFRTGQPSTLPELPVQYADYAAWQRGWLKGDALEAQLSFWRGQLGGAPRLLELPTDRPRPAVQGTRSAILHRMLPERLTQALRTLGQREGATLYMTLLAGFQVLLSRHSGQTDIVVGADIANRHHAETEGLIGFFINQLALRARLEDDPTFLTLLGRVKDTALGAYAHQDLPFEELVKAINPERSLAHAPLFQVKLILQNTPTSALELPGLTFRASGAESVSSNLDLTLSITETPQGLSCQWVYSTDLFDASTMDRMSTRLRALLESAVAEPAARVSSLTVLSAEERRTLLEDWNDTALALPEDGGLHGLVEAQVERTPDAVAVEFQGESLTYRELNARANQLAWHLRGLGVRAETRVGVCLERSLELVVALLGVLKAGGAYVPLDPSYPSERLGAMLEDARVPVVVTQDTLADEVPSRGEWLLSVDAEAATIARKSKENPPSLTDARNAAYVIFTSGSTGRPKGVLVEHRGIRNTILRTVGDFDVQPGRRVLQFTAFGFDASVLEIFGTLAGGGTLVLVPRDALLPGPELTALLRDQHITTSVLLPPVLAALPQEALPELQTIISGAEALPSELVERWGVGRRFVNCYGPTEISVTATSAEVAPGEGRPGIGRPYPNTRLYVLDGTGQPVPTGVLGELFIGGMGVGRGYLERPDLTAERFVPDAFGGEPGGRLYRTGDVVRYRADGQLEFAGRADHQVKLRGFRIELGEIEAVLGQDSTVRDVVVVAREDVPGQKRLVAYVVPHEEETADAEALRRFVKERLPEYMVPSAVVSLDALPLTPNGKVDRKALPRPDVQRLAAEPEEAAPRPGVETTLAGIWAELLGVERVGRTSDFFELGGHSLLATQAVSRIRQAFRVDLPVRAFFEMPNVAALAAWLSAHVQASGPEVPPLVPVSREQPLPLSFAQQRLWFLDQLEPGSLAYNIPLTVSLEGALDVPALVSAFQEILRRHESLRTAFGVHAGEPVQVISGVPDVALEVVDLGTLTPEVAGARLEQRALEESRRPFDLSRGPLVRATLLRQDAHRHMLLLTMHHIVSDGWSMGIFMREMAALYEAFHAGRPSPLPELPVQYADYAAWQRGWLKGDALEAQLSYWREQLRDTPRLLELPTDRARPTVRTHRAGTVPTEFPKELSEKLQALSQQEGATLYMTLLAGFQALLSRYSGQTDIVVGTDIANRNHAETEGLIGFFVNQLAMRTRLDDAPTFRMLLRRVKDTALGAYAHQDLPFEELVKAINPERSLGHAPVFQVKLSLQNTPAASIELPGLKLRSLGRDEGAAKLDLTLSFKDTGAGLVCISDYRADLFERTTVERMMEHLRVLLEGVAANPDVSVGALPLLDATERLLVLKTWNQTAEAVPSKSIPEMFEAQVERVPGAIAVVADGKQLTYAELDAKANRLARALVKEGVGPEVLVGLYVERTVEAVVGMLGILKAGGGYVPMDTSFPAARVKAIAEDASLRVVVTQRAYAEDVAGLGCTTVVVEAVEEAGGSTERVESGVLGGNAVYAIFTSGSTGRPKGVVVEHRQLANYVETIRGRLKLVEGMSFASVTTLAADLGHTAVFPMLCGGGTLHLVAKDVASDAEALGAYMQAHRVEGLKVVPSHLRALLSGPNAKQVLPLKRLVVGGEASDRALVETVQRLAPECAVFNHYGPTETTVGVLTNAVEGAWDEGAATLALGRPIGNARMYVLDASGRPVPRGVAGELYVGGAVVTRGYVGRPELTAERYVP